MFNPFSFNIIIFMAVKDIDLLVVLISFIHLSSVAVFIKMSHAAWPQLAFLS